MSSGLQNYYDELEDKFIKSEDRKQKVEAIRNSEWLNRYKELEDKFKEWEEYKDLKERLHFSTEQLQYNFKLDEDIHGIINKKE